MAGSRVHWMLGWLVALLLGSTGAATAGTPSVYLCLGALDSCCPVADAVTPAWLFTSDAPDAALATASYTLCLRTGSSDSGEGEGAASCSAGTGDGDELCAWQIDLATSGSVASPLSISGFSPCSGLSLTTWPSGEELPAQALGINWVFDADPIEESTSQCVGTLDLSWAPGADPGDPPELIVAASSEAIRANMADVSLDAGQILVPEPAAPSLWWAGLALLLTLGRRRARRLNGATAALILLISVSGAKADLVGEVGKITATSLQLPAGWQVGASVAAVGDINGDGVEDMVLGAPEHDQARGAIMFLLMRHDGSVDDVVRFGSGTPGMGSMIIAGDRFGAAVAAVGDLDGDGASEVAVAAPGRRHVYILFLAPRTALVPVPKVSSNLRFQLAYPVEAMAPLGDLDGDGTADLVVGHPAASLGCNSECGAVEILRLNTDGSLREATTFGNGSLGSIVLTDGERFGASLAFLGSLYGGGTVEVAVGAPGREPSQRGGVDILSLTDETDGAITTRIHSGMARFPAASGPLVTLGSSVAAIGDLDADGNLDLAIGAYKSGSQQQGAAVLLQLSAQANSIKGGVVVEASDLPAGVMGASTYFGQAMAALDVDADGDLELMVGAEEEGGNDDGVVWQLHLSDVDDDLMADFVDNCPDLRNQAQVDSDFDGVGDKCDNCVRISNASQLDSNTDGIGDVCEETEVRLIEDPEDQGEDRWRIELECGAAPDVDQIVVALTPLGAGIDQFSFGGPAGAGCGAPTSLCQGCDGCGQVPAGSPYLGGVVDRNASGVFLTDAAGENQEVGRTGLRPDSAYVVLQASDDLCTAGEWKPMGDLLWDRGNSGLEGRPAVSLAMARVADLGPIKSKAGTIENFSARVQRNAAVCRVSGRSRMMKAAYTPYPDLEVELLPMVTSNLQSVTTFELCFTYWDTDLLHRLTVAVAPPFDQDGDGIGDDLTMQWQDCDGTPDPATGIQACDSTESGLSATVYTTVDAANSFAFVDSDVASATYGYRFLVLEGSVGLSEPSLGALSPVVGSLQCVARVELRDSGGNLTGVNLQPCEGCDVADFLPTLLVANASDYSPLPTSSCVTTPQLIDQQWPGDCTGLCGLMAGDVASTLSEDIDNDDRRNEEDNCIFEANTDQADSGAFEWLDDDQPEGTGDVCQCGEATGDGSISSDQDVDLASLLSHLVDPDPQVESRCSVDGAGACTIRDAVMLKRTLEESSLPNYFDPDDCEAATGG